MRRREFSASCRLLKVTHGEVLNYRDGALDKVDFYSAVGELTRKVHEIKPQVVITLGPEGGLTSHPDHAMAGLIATLAFHWAGRRDRPRNQSKDGAAPFRPQKLYYATATFTIPDRQPVSLAPVSAVIDIAEFLETKIDAFKQHRSQAPLFKLFEGLVRQRGAKEYFHLAASSTPRVAEQETDLLAGVANE
jgi:LmbE family N-acetylglucosaminyl deacetylase